MNQGKQEDQELKARKDHLDRQDHKERLVNQVRTARRALLVIPVLKVKEVSVRNTAHLTAEFSSKTAPDVKTLLSNNLAGLLADNAPPMILVLSLVLRH